MLRLEGDTGHEPTVYDHHLVFGHAEQEGQGVEPSEGLIRECSHDLPMRRAELLGWRLVATVRAPGTQAMIIVISTNGARPSLNRKGEHAGGVRALGHQVADQ